jgi:hypothetical protein
MPFEYSLMPHWPQLAWLARCSDGEQNVSVLHGPGVELYDDWFCEAAWAGPFEEGDFDLTDIVAGTGGRLRDDKIIFVSSGSTVDRLQVLVKGPQVWVSNSLACLLEKVDASVDPTYGQYHRDFGSINHGLNSYKRELLTSAGAVRLVYFNNLAWDGQKLEEVAKPGERRDFSSFELYRRFLDACMTRMAENLSHRGRRLPFKPLATVSSGYDSPTVATLARKAGCEEALCFGDARGGIEERGEEIARILGLRPSVFARESWRTAGTLAEPPFIAADGIGMDLVFKSAESILRGRVLFTGYHGDKVWSKETADLSDDIVRGDRSGLSLSEFRLSAGFLHCPVPFWGVRQMRDIHAVSTSQGMRQWDVPGGYSRPICRRIVEETGVPRHLFGVRNAAVAYLLGNTPVPLARASMVDYRRWLRDNTDKWRVQGKRSPLAIPWLDSAYWLAKHGLWKSAKRLLDWGAGKPVVWRVTGIKALYRLAEAPHGTTDLVGLRRYFYPWALERTKQLYKAPPPDGKGETA